MRRWRQRQILIHNVQQPTNLIYIQYAHCQACNSNVCTADDSKAEKEERYVISILRVDLSSSSTVDDDSWKHIQIYIYIYISVDREREREREYASDIRHCARECQTHIHGGIVKIRNRQARSIASDRSKA
jgi:hypothetical protein